MNMERFSKLWWASILLSSVVTGGGTFVSLTLFTTLPVETVIKASVTLILVGDIALALMMEALSPTRVRVGPGESRHRNELPREPGTVVADFEDRRGKILIRGERWRARLADGCNEMLPAGTTVRVVEREGLTLVVKAVEQE